MLQLHTRDQPTASKEEVTEPWQLQDTEETIKVKQQDFSSLTKIVSEYDQEIPQIQTTDNP